MYRLILCFILIFSISPKIYCNENQAMVFLEDELLRQNFSKMTEDEIFNMAGRVFAIDKNCDLMTDMMLRSKGYGKDEYLQLLKRAAQEFHDNASVLSAIGSIYLSGTVITQDQELAKEFCNKALAIDPKYPRARLLLAEILRTEGNEKEAIKQLEFATKDLNPADARQFFGFVQLCTLLVKNNEQEKAELYFERLLQTQDIKKAFPLALFSAQLRNIGKCNLANMYLEKAKKHFKDEVQSPSTSKELNSATAGAYMCYARILAVYGEHEVSKLFAENAVKLNPKMK